MADVVELNCVTRLDLPPERIIRAAAEANLEGVVVLGWDKEGEFYFASSYANGPEVVWLCELAKKYLLGIETDGDL